MNLEQGTFVKISGGGIGVVSGNYIRGQRWSLDIDSYNEHLENEADEEYDIVEIREASDDFSLQMIVERFNDMKLLWEKIPGMTYAESIKELDPVVVWNEGSDEKVVGVFSHWIVKVAENKMMYYIYTSGKDDKLSVVGYDSCKKLNENNYLRGI